MTLKVRVVPTLRFEMEDGTPYRLPASIVITPQIEAALNEYMSAFIDYVPGGESASVVEIPMLGIARAVLISLGIPESAWVFSPPLGPPIEPAGTAGVKRRPLSVARRLKILLRDGGKCLKCGATDDLSIDHIIPVSKGGSDDDENLRTLCVSCNSAKRDRLDP